MGAGKHTAIMHAHTLEIRYPTPHLKIYETGGFKLTYIYTPSKPANLMSVPLLIHVPSGLIYFLFLKKSFCILKGKGRIT